MDIHTAAQYMKHGYRIRRASDPDLSYLEYHDDTLWVKHKFAGYLPALLLLEDLLATDWELITEGIIKDFPVIYSD